MNKMLVSTRRDFVKKSLVAAAGIPVFRFVGSSSNPLSRLAANDRLNIAIVGAGGRGLNNLQSVQSENVVALCDVDDVRCAEARSSFPKAAFYKDFRRMLDKESSLDAVVVSTPDHTHAVVSIAAMQRGLHVYCEKPLAHSIYELRRMKETARESGVVTQMGQQGHAFEGSRRVVEVIRSGAIGMVRELHVWTDRPAGWWPQGEERPTESHSVPDTLDWDLWQGPATERPYHPVYAPFSWRGRWDYGTGSIGDMGVHDLDSAYWALDLGLPDSARVVASSMKTSDCPPLQSIIEVDYPSRGNLPPVKLTFYDGFLHPPTDLFHGEPIPTNGSLVVGEKGTLFTRDWHGGNSPENMFLLLPKEKFESYTGPDPFLPRTEEHHLEWLDACKGGPPALSDFDYAANLSEGLLLGFLALRLGRPVQWDAANMKAIGDDDADQFIHPNFRSGWEF